MHCAQLGVRIAIDDFGTGYSSLDYLRQFPVDTIKIDRSFVARVNDDDDDRAIVASLLSLAATLGVRVVAEGVETSEQLRVLRRLGCSLGQGFLWSPASLPPNFPGCWSDSGSRRRASCVTQRGTASSVDSVAAPDVRGISQEHPDGSWRCTTPVCRSAPSRRH